jgi:xylulokinase
MSLYGRVLAFDVGTTSLKCSAISIENFEPLSTLSTKATVSYPRQGWAEQDLERLWKDLVGLGRKVLDQVGKPVDAVIFDAHMAGVVPVDREGNPLRPAIIWLDERAAGLPRKLWSGPLRVQGYSPLRLLEFLRVTGGAPSRTGKDFISKVIWMEENEPTLLSNAYKILDITGFLVNRCTGEFVMGEDQASLTWMADTRGGKAQWHNHLLKEYGIRDHLLPRIRKTTEVIGKLKDRELGEGVPVLMGAGDLTAAAVGSGAVGEGEVHVYLGTSDWIAFHSLRRRVDVFHFVGSILSGIPGMYLTVAEQEVAAGALEWAMSILDLMGYDEVKKLVDKVRETKVLFLPWFYGERAPVDDPSVRGGILNLTLGSSKGDILRAVMEGVALNLKWVYPYVERMAGSPRVVRIVGGGALFDSWCQAISSALKVKVVRVSNPQLTGVRGLAAIASVGLGMYTFQEATKRFRMDREFLPDVRESEDLERKFSLFKRSYRNLKGTFRALNLRA